MNSDCQLPGLRTLRLNAITLEQEESDEEEEEEAGFTSMDRHALKLIADQSGVLFRLPKP